MSDDRAHLSRSCRDHADAARGARGDGARRWRPGPTPARRTPKGARRARRSRRRGATIAEALGWRHDVIFTSGASEAVEIVAARAKVAAARSSARPSIRSSSHAMGDGVDGASGRARRADRSMRRSTRCSPSGPALVAIQQVNNETGVIQPLERIAERVREAGSLLLADCAQARARCRCPTPTSSPSAAHKLGGPPGIGALLVRDLATLEAGRRAGAGLSPRDRERAGRARLRRRAGEPRPYDDAMPRLRRCAQRLEDGDHRGGRRRDRRRKRRASRRSARIAMPGACERQLSWCSSTSPGSRCRREAPAHRAA